MSKFAPLRAKIYTEMARYYDLINNNKGYKKEVDFLEKVFRAYGLEVKDILDVACGTGNHTARLVKLGYNVVGVDLNRGMLDIARRKVENAVFVKCDMRNLELDQSFDAVICMFNSIVYNQTLSELGKTLIGFRNCLKARGIVIFDTYLLRDRFVHGFKDVTGYDSDKLTIATFSFFEKFGRNGRMTVSYLIREGPNFNYIMGDVHEFGLFSLPEIVGVLRKAGFTADVYWNFTMEDPPRKSKFLGDFVFVGIKK